MSLLQLLQQSQNGAGLSALAEQVGLDPAKAGELTDMLAPVIGKAAKAQVDGGGLSGMIGALQGEDQASLFDDPAQAASAEGQAQGAQFLSGILGDNGATGLAHEAAERTGIDAGQIAAFLPALAAMAQGGLQKSMPDEALSSMIPAQANSSGGLMSMVSGLLGGAGNAQDSAQNPALGMLTSFLDADGDGSVVDDILEKIQR